MKTLHRLLLAFGIVVSTALLTVLGSAAASARAAAPSAPSSPTARSAPPAQSAQSAPTTPVAQPLAASVSSCSSVRQIGTKKVVQDKGMSAFTVRQYLGWCSDANGSAWMNYASVYVWSQYHALGFSYRAQVGILVQGESEARGYVVGANRSRLTYSSPVRTTKLCTQGWGKLARNGGESAVGRSSLVC